ncbi:LbetaH domain-containing protein [Magnetovibrio blakemorei]|uniref:Chloramphenicol acetyltransferase n=1 Tax=Magnetovibrio blakemorei TaxID=28181 RepID=A0A1E5Q4L3_9PROT|nr:chloramphenicol acetyltransferase [Magnetovibrio blakemorei]OEJ65063.1 chloramphenicol acetyltransferase [Magnetovibrio blakemorei]
MDNQWSRTLGTQACIHPTANVTADCTLGLWTEVGERTKLSETVMGDYSYICNDGDVIYTTIGKFCSIAAHVRINPGNHPLERAALHHFTYRTALFELGEDDPGFFDWRRGFPVTIGNDVWVGHGVTVMGNVTIGDGAAIGSGAVVTKDVAPYTIIGGVPGKPIRKRFDDETCEKLAALKWWDWPRELINERMDDFRRLDAGAFADKYL